MQTNKKSYDVMQSMLAIKTKKLEISHEFMEELFGWLPEAYKQRYGFGNGFTNFNKLKLLAVLDQEMPQLTDKQLIVLLLHIASYYPANRELQNACKGIFELANFPMLQKIFRQFCLENVRKADPNFKLLMYLILQSAYADERIPKFSFFITLGIFTYVDTLIEVAETEFVAGIRRDLEELSIICLYKLLAYVEHYGYLISRHLLMPIMARSTLLVMLLFRYHDNTNSWVEVSKKFLVLPIMRHLKKF